MSVYNKLSLFNARVLIIFVHIYMNVNKLCLNQKNSPSWNTFCPTKKPAQINEIKTNSSNWEFCFRISPWFHFQFRLLAISVSDDYGTRCRQHSQDLVEQLPVAPFTRFCSWNNVSTPVWEICYQRSGAGKMGDLSHLIVVALCS